MNKKILLVIGIMTVLFVSGCIGGRPTDFSERFCTNWCRSSDMFYYDSEDWCSGMWKGQNYPERNYIQCECIHNIGKEISIFRVEC